MRRHEIPGGWYCDVSIGGAFVSQPAGGGALTFNAVTVPAPGGRLLQVRINTAGTHFCGVGENDGIAWEWVGTWVNRGPIFGNNAVIYDTSSALVVVSLNQAPTWALGWWYVDDAGQLVPSWLCYDHSTELADTLGIDGLWQWTQRGDCVAGQGIASGAGYAGVDMLVEGRRVRIAEGQCTFVRFYRVGDALALSWIRERPDHASCFLWLTRQEAGALPTYVPDTTDPVDPVDPVDPKPEPTMQYDTGPLNAYAQNRWLQLPHGTRHEQGESLFRILYEFRSQTGHPIEVFRSGRQGPKYFLASDGFWYSDDIVVVNEGPNGKWYKDAGIRFGDPEASLNFGGEWLHPNGNDADLCFPPPAPAGVVEPPPPPPPPDLTARVEELERAVAVLGMGVQNVSAAIMKVEARTADVEHRVSDLEDAPTPKPTPGTFDPNAWRVRTPVRYLGTFTGTIEAKEP